VTFGDASTASGQFDLDLTNGTLANVNVAAEISLYTGGTSVSMRLQWRDRGLA